MRVLLIYPKYPNTFWSFKYALRFIGKKAAYPPLGLLTVAAMLPEIWEKKCIDMNVNKLRDRELENADMVFLSAMSIQKASAQEVIARCNRLGVKVVAGGPLFTVGYDEFAGVDHFVLNEAEITLPRFLDDLEKGCAKPIYTTTEYADLDATPPPLWGLIKLRKYVSLSIQYSRGCPFNCDFCDITNLFGHRFRTKSWAGLKAELENLYAHGWRGEVFFVDDNFIGNKRKMKTEILPALIAWMERKKHPFSFITQASIDLSDDEELMGMMDKAGFTSVFVGIESTNEESLAECNKLQNKGRDLVACVKKIQRFGLRVIGGFIVGFDSDQPTIFDRLIEFIKTSGIVTAMVGLLNAPRGTKLEKRLQGEDRLLKGITGDNTDASLNFIPKMKQDTLLDGYKRIIGHIYAPKVYYERVKRFLREYKPAIKLHFHFKLLRLNSGYSWVLFKSIWFLGVKDKARLQFWRIFFWSLFLHPRLLPQTITYSIHGFHFRSVFNNIGA
jgi:radical SAM superfamily enzyme YgiQ (UPF0313 family)